MPAGIADFDAARSQPRVVLGDARRMAYKSLNDNVRLHALPGFLAATERLAGALVSIAIDKRAGHRFIEIPGAAPPGLSLWAARAFGRLTTVGHLAGLIIEGVRGQGQNLIWFTDEDEIAPNDAKHREASTVLGHLLSHYCTADMGHFRFGTTASDPGDLLIEDLAAVPDLAAGGLNAVLTELAPHPESSTVEALFVPPGGVPPKVSSIAGWLGTQSGTLSRVQVVIDEGPGGCAVRRFRVTTDLTGLR